jgi:hypothetical protein
MYNIVPNMRRKTTRELVTNSTPFVFYIEMCKIFLILFIFNCRDSSDFGASSVPTFCSSVSVTTSAISV